MSVRRSFARIAAPPALAVVVATAALMALLPRPLSSDVAGQLWIAHALRRGVRLYVDVFEINPPLWFWMAMPVDWLAERLRVPADTMLIAANGAAVLASVVATARMLGAWPHRTGFLLYAVAILLLASARDIGQRECLVLIATLPYCTLAAARREGRGVSWRLAMLVGVAAGAGFALKPHFLLAPALVELWLLASLRRGWRPFRAETVALAATGVAYAAAVVTVTPAYLTDTLAVLRAAYVGSGVAWRAMVLPAQAVWLFILAVLASQHRLLIRAPLTVALTLAGVGFAAAWAIQHKGWPYHAIPTTGALALALAALLAEAQVGEGGRRIAVAVLTLPLALTAMPTHAPLSGEDDIAPLLAGMRPGDALGLISTEGFTAWPAVLDRGLRPASRYNQYWMLAAVDANPQAAAFGWRVVRETARDWRCLPPRRVVIARPAPGGRAADDPLRYFARDPAFAAVLGGYRPWRRHGIFEAYVPTTPPLIPMRSHLCRRAV